MANNPVDRYTTQHYTWGNNCDSWVLADTEGLSVKQESMPAGATDKLHFHNQAQQFFFILKDTATFYCEANKHILSEQQGIKIPPNSKHFIANENSSPPEFLVISQPSTNNDKTTIE